MYEYSDLEKIWNSLSQEHEKQAKVGAPSPQNEDPIKAQYFAAKPAKPSVDVTAQPPRAEDSATAEFNYLKKELEIARKEILELTHRLEEKEEELLNVNQYLEQIEKFIAKFD
ncbi:MAG: hypothetical protein H6850_02840 [Alphaproteobacteria bacterium]|nr:MAG: hypothetical protein H6850_02840 [Alphaproteobacteria bacterium]